jgi:hypothetical protein
MTTTPTSIPTPLEHLVNAVTRSLPPEEAQAFYADLAAVPTGTDLTLVPDAVFLDLLADPDRGVWRHCPEGTNTRTAVDQVADLLRRRLNADEPTSVEWTVAAVDAAQASNAVRFTDGAATWAAQVAADAARVASSDHTATAPRAAHAVQGAAQATTIAARATATPDRRIAAGEAAGDEHMRWIAGLILHHLRKAR